MADVSNINNKTVLAKDATVVESTPIRSQIIDTGTDVVVVATTVGPSTVPYFDENTEYVAKPIDDFAEVIVATGTVTEALGAAATEAANEAAEAAVGPATEAAAQYAANALNSQNLAQQAADDARNASNINTYYPTPEDPTGTIQGLAGTEEGGSFRVGITSVVGETVAYNNYRKLEGVAVYINSEPNLQYVESVKELAAETARRTTGLYTSTAGDNPFSLLWPTGRSPFYVGKDNIVNAPKGIKTKKIDASEFSLYTLSTQVIQALQPPGSISEFNIQNAAGRGLFNWNDQLEEFQLWGEVVHHIRGIRKGDFFAIGDSITAYGIATSDKNGDGTSYKPCMRDQSWHAWASLYSNGRLRVVGIGATGGYTTSQINSVWLPVALESKATFVVVMAGRNDVFRDYDIDTQTLPYFINIFRSLRNNGQIPVICTMSAQGNSEFPNRRIAEHRINNFLRAYANKYNLPLVDLHRYTVDPVVGDWIPGLNQDASHPTGAGAKLMGKALYDGFLEWTSKVYPPRADEQLTMGLTKNRVPNPLFLNNNGNNPNSWVITAAGNNTITPASSGVGNRWSVIDTSAYLTFDVEPSNTYILSFSLSKELNGPFGLWAVAGDQNSTVMLGGLRDWKEAIDEQSFFCFEITLPEDVTQVTLILGAYNNATNLEQIAFIQTTEN